MAHPFFFRRRRPVRKTYRRKTASRHFVFQPLRLRNIRAVGANRVVFRSQAAGGALRKTPVPEKNTAAFVPSFRRGRSVKARNGLPQRHPVPNGKRRGNPLRSVAARRMSRRHRARGLESDPGIFGTSECERRGERVLLPLVKTENRCRAVAVERPIRRILKSPSRNFPPLREVRRIRPNARDVPGERGTMRKQRRNGDARRTSVPLGFL